MWRVFGGVSECGEGDVMCCAHWNWYVWIEDGCVDDGFSVDCWA